MKKRFVNLLKSRFVKNVTVMATGAAGAQMVVMGLSPIITRLYGPEAFGIMGTFNSMITIIIPIAALTYPVAIVLPKSNRQAKGLIQLSIILSLIMALISLIIILIFGEHITNIFNLKEISNYLYLIPVVIIFAGLMQVAQQWLIRTEQFSISARVNFIQSIIINVSKVIIGIFKPVAAVLVTITALSNGLKALMMLIFSRKKNNEKRKSFRLYKFKELSKLGRKYYDFPIYRAPESFFSKLSQGLPVLMLTAFFGPASGGFYTLGRTVLAMPSRFIGNAVGDVFYPRIAEAYNKKENVSKIIKKATFALTGIGFIPFGLVILFGPFLFKIVFGNDWIVAGEYARWIALWSYSNFINKPSVRSLAVLNAQKFHLMFTICSTVLRVIVLTVGFFVFSSDVIAVLLFGVSGAILNICLIVLTINISNQRRKVI